MELVQTFTELSIIIFSGAISGFIALKFKLPTIVGYILAGLAIGVIIPYVATDYEFNSEFIRNIAELGIALLLFAAGIEFSTKSISNIKYLVVFGSLIQTILIVFLGILVMNLFGLSMYESFFIGVVVATSSTAFVLKMLEQRDEISNKASRIMVGWLVMQDIVIVPLFLLLDTYSPTSETNPDLLLTLFKSIVVIVITIGVGKFIVPHLMKTIASTNSQELLLVSVVALSVGFALFSEYMGVSYTLGSFLAGLALSDTFLRHEVFNEIKPLRDLFTMVFFVSIGTFFNIEELFNNALILFGIIVILVSLKVLIIFFINVLFKVHTINALKVSLGIAQIGEFAFIAISIGLQRNWIDTKMYSIVLVATIITISLTPLFYTKSDSIYRFLEERMKDIWPRMYRKLFINMRISSDTEKTLHNHVIVCGYGKVGKYIAEALKYSKSKYIVAEIDSVLAQKATNDGHLSLFGDSTNVDILNQANLQEAKVIVVALPQTVTATLSHFIETIRQINPSIKIIARANALNMEKSEMVDHIVDPEFEASVNIVKILKNTMNISKTDVASFVRNTRKQELRELKN